MDKYKFRVDNDGYIELIAYCFYEDKYVIIPSKIDGKPIVRIGHDCFFNHPEILSISFPETLISIGENAFALCKGLRELLLPDSIIDIGIYAFRDCTGLKKIVLPKNLKCLKFGVFSFCYLSDDTEIILNEGLETIESKAFSCGGLCSGVKIYIPESVKEIAQDAFEDGMRIMDSTHKVISDKELDNHIEKCCRFLLEVCNDYHSGLRSDNELMEYFSNCVYENFFKYLENKGIYYSISEQSWNGFLADYEAWMKSAPLDIASLGESWLYKGKYIENVPDGCSHWSHKGEEADSFDKNCFFKLKESFMIPIEFFKPISLIKKENGEQIEYLDVIRQLIDHYLNQTANSMS